jgi:hypothetical protein
MLYNSGKSLTIGPLKPLIVPRKAPVDGSNASQRITVTVFDQSGAHLTSANDSGGFGPCRFFCEWPVYAVGKSTRGYPVSKFWRPHRRRFAIQPIGVVYVGSDHSLVFEHCRLKKSVDCCSLTDALVALFNGSIISAASPSIVVQQSTDI